MKCNLVLRTDKDRFPEVVRTLVEEYEGYYGQPCALAQGTGAGVMLLDDCGQSSLQAMGCWDLEGYSYSFDPQEVVLASWTTSAGNWIQFSRYEDECGLGLFIEFQGRRHSLCQDMVRFLPRGYRLADAEVRSMVSSSSAMPWECGVSADSPAETLDAYRPEVEEAVLHFMRTGEESPVAMAKSASCGSLIKPGYQRRKIKDAPCVLYPRYGDGPVPTWWVGPYELRNSCKLREYVRASYALGVNPLPELRKEWAVEFMPPGEVETLYSSEYDIDHTPCWGDDDEPSWDEERTLILAETERGDIVGVEISHP